MVGRITNDGGVTWKDMVDAPVVSDVQPVKPVVGEGNDEIFVAIPTFRDGERCARTLKALFDKADNPSKVRVGLIEQNEAHDKQCLIEYCSLQGVAINPQSFKSDLTFQLQKCPHYGQIRYLAVFNVAAKGPNYARSLARKVLGNEEYCMQIDAHSDFTRDWDLMAKTQWEQIGNEYGVLSTIPARTDTMAMHEPGGDKETEVNRLCSVGIASNTIPVFPFFGDGKVQGIQKPLLAHAWSAAFSFAKCHLEESAPYDNFAPQLFDAEQFPRYARFWTRGYDVYTPTRNLVYHDYTHLETVDPKGWKKNEPERKRALTRVMTLLRLKGGLSSSSAQANLGIYGLGKRRTLKQLEKFMGGIDLKNGIGNPQGKHCDNKQWVPYDATISPMEHLYTDADDLDPQPEYPMRTTVAGQLKLEPKMASVEELGVATNSLPVRSMRDDAPSGILIFVLWVFGLFLWYMCFAKKGGKRGLPMFGNETKGPRRWKKGHSGKDGKAV